MRSKSFIAVSGLIVLLLVLAGGVYACDTNRNDLIAEGIRVGGVIYGDDWPALRRGLAAILPLESPR